MPICRPLQLTKSTTISRMMLSLTTNKSTSSLLTQKRTDSRIIYIRSLKRKNLKMIKMKVNSKRYMKIPNMSTQVTKFLYKSSYSTKHRTSISNIYRKPTCQTTPDVRHLTSIFFQIHLMRQVHLQILDNVLANLQPAKTTA